MTAAVGIITVFFTSPASAGRVTMHRGVTRYACAWQASSHDCSERIVTVRGDGNGAVATLHLLAGARWRRVDLTIDFCHATDYAVDITDSPSGNAFGGDSGDTRHDAEIQLLGPRRAAFNAWSVFQSDAGGGGPYAAVGLFAAGECGSAAWSIADGALRFWANPDQRRPTASLRRNRGLFDFPPYDSADWEDPERRWEDTMFVGINRSVATPDRRGGGVRRVRFRLSTSDDDPLTPPRW